MYCGSWNIDDLLTFTVVTHQFDTGIVTDADSVPTYRVYENETTVPILTGSMALLDSSNTAGFYSEQITLSAANGFEDGKCYTIYITATVNGIAGATTRNFQINARVQAVLSATALADLAEAIASLDLSTLGAVADLSVANHLRSLLTWQVTASGPTGFQQKIYSDKALTTIELTSNLTQAAGNPFVKSEVQ